MVKRESLFLRVTPSEKQAVVSAAKKKRRSLNDEARKLIQRAYRIRDEYAVASDATGTAH